MGELYKDAYVLSVIGVYGGSLMVSVSSTPRCSCETTPARSAMVFAPGHSLYSGSFGFSLGIIADLLGLDVEGDNDARVIVVPTLEELEKEVRLQVQAHFAAKSEEPDDFAETIDANVERVMREVRAQEAYHKEFAKD